jgi:hypothetical protein
MLAFNFNNERSATRKLISEDRKQLIPNAEYLKYLWQVSHKPLHKAPHQQIPPVCQYEQHQFKRQ